MVMVMFRIEYFFCGVHNFLKSSLVLVYCREERSVACAEQEDSSCLLSRGASSWFVLRKDAAVAIYGRLPSVPCEPPLSSSREVSGA